MPPPEIWKPTRWTLVRRAIDRADVEAANRALDELIAAYREPVVFCLRRRLRGDSGVDQAVDAFWGWILEKQILRRLADGGRFRASMQRAVQHYAQEWRRSARILGNALDEVPDVPDTGSTSEPDAAEEQAWASTILARAMAALQTQNAAAVEILARRYGLGRHEPATPEQLAQELGMTKNAVNQAVDRARRKLRELLDAEVRQITADPDAYAEERETLVGRLLEANPVLVEPDRLP